MTRMPYKRAYWRIVPFVFLLAIPGFALFGFGCYLDFAFDVHWAPPVTGVLFVILSGGLHLFFRDSLLKRIRCPKCGRVPLKPTEDGRRIQLLICDACGIEWDTGISNDYSN